MIRLEKNKRQYRTPHTRVVVFPGMEVMAGDGSEQWIAGMNQASGANYNVGAPASTNTSDAEWASGAGANGFGFFFAE